METPMEQRPTIEEVEPVYLAMMEEIQQVLTDEFGVGAWVQHRERIGGSGCDEVEGGERRSYNLGSAGPISEDEWDDALAAVQAVASEQGFTGLDEVVDEPGDDLVRIEHALGGYVRFGTKEATILGVRTGCHPVSTAATTGD